jgi:hypothetical protein
MRKTAGTLESFFGRKAAVYRNLESALLKLTDGRYPDDPAASEFSLKRNRSVFWRPFLEIDYWKYDFIIPILPFPGSWLPQAVIFKDDALQNSAQKEIPGAAEKGYTPVSPVLLCLLRHVLLQLKRVIDENRFSDDWWNRFEIFPWRRKGPYLFFEDDPVIYKKMFFDFLREGILINPDSRAASIIPGECSDGEFKKFRKLCRSHRR